MKSVNNNLLFSLLYVLGSEGFIVDIIEFKSYPHWVRLKEKSVLHSGRRYCRSVEYFATALKWHWVCIGLNINRDKRELNIGESNLR